MGLLYFIYTRLAKIARFLGFDLIVSRRLKRNYGYEGISPIINYAPWVSDDEFKRIYKTITLYTLIDRYRCYELWQLVQETARLKGSLIEVGVWRGGSGALIAKRAKSSGIKEKVYLCDTFKGVVKVGKKDSTYEGGEHANASKQDVEEILKKLNLNNIKILTGIFPEETSKFIKDKKFRFCHIDVDVYESAKDTLKWVWPKLVVGGIVVFDDYGLKACDGVTELVNEQRNKQDRIVIHNLNGHGLVIKISS